MSQTEAIGGVFAEEITVADITPHGIDAAMTSLVHDGAFGFAGGGSGGGKTGAQAVTGKLAMSKPSAST